MSFVSPVGPKISCKGWIQEAAMRMLLNNLETIPFLPKYLIRRFEISSLDLNLEISEITLPLI